MHVYMHNAFYIETCIYIYGRCRCIALLRVPIHDASASKHTRYIHGRCRINCTFNGFYPREGVYVIDVYGQ